MPTLQPFPFGAFVVEVVFLGDTAAFALGDGTIRLAKGVAAEEVKAHQGAVLTAIRSADGKAILTGGDDGRLVRTTADGKTETVAERPRKWIEQLAAGPGGAIAFSAGREAVVRFADGRERSFQHERAVAGLAFAPKGARLAVTRYNGATLHWYNAETPPVMLEWKGAHGPATFSPDNRFLISSMQENALHGWRLADSGDLRMSGYPAKPKSMAWTAKGKYLATSGAEMAVLWPFTSKDGPQGKTPLQIGTRDALVTRVAAHPIADAIALGYSDGAVAMALISGERPGLLRKPQDGRPVTALAFDANGRRFAFGTEAGEAGIVEI